MTTVALRDVGEGRPTNNLLIYGKPVAGLLAAGFQFMWKGDEKCG